MDISINNKKKPAESNPRPGLSCTQVGSKGFTNHVSDAEKNTDDQHIDAADLFSLFTADIIKKEVLFTR